MEQEQNSEPSDKQINLLVKCENCNEVIGAIPFASREEARELFGSGFMTHTPCPFADVRPGEVCHLRKEQCNCGS